MSAIVEYKEADAYDGYSSGVYRVPNETFDAWYTLLEELSVSRAAAICSSGEIGLLTVLPRVTDELVLFDHSYAAFYITMLKCGIVKEAGIDKAYEFFTKDSEGLSACAAAVKNNIPREIYEGYKRATGRVNSFYYDEAPEFLEDKSDSRGYIHEMRGYWQGITLDQARAGFEKLELVRFLHGTFSDLEDEGPFELLYMSNAHHYGSRDGQMVVKSRLQKLVAPGGHIAVAESNYDTWHQERCFTGFTLVNEYKTTSYNTWKYRLWQVPE